MNFCANILQQSSARDTMHAMKSHKHLFVFSPGLAGTTSKEEVEATAAGLNEVGLYHPPYDRDVFIQIHAREVVGPHARPYHHVIYGPFGRDQVPVMVVLDERTGWTSETMPIGNEVDDLAMLLVVLLATKNAVKRTAYCKLAKLGIGKSHRHRFVDTTTISLPAERDADGENPPRGTKVAPHLRRGHVRRQHYGAGNQMEKKIWIASVFVNADPDFVATRTKYRIGRSLSTAAA